MTFLILPGIFSGSVWQIVANSSIFGILILLVLVIMSFVSWMIVFNKWRQFRKVDEADKAFLSVFNRSRRLSDSVGQARSFSGSPISKMFSYGYAELTSLHEFKNESGGLQQTVRPLENGDFEIIEMGMEKSMTDEITKLEKQVVFLATTANAAPFMGLLGTVVGVMDSFWAIGERGSASLAVVAPGIAEALLATIVGLGAAIPAVIAFNWANNKMKIVSDQANSFILQFMAQAKKEAMR